MSTRIVVVFAHGDGGEWPFHMDLSESGGPGGITVPDFSSTTTFNLARDHAYNRARQLIGGPDFHTGIACSLARIGQQDRPPLSRGSLYGPISMASMQLLANGSGKGKESEMRHYVRAQLKAIRFADLSTVAVSADGDTSTGDFRPVDGIEDKLRSLAKLGPEVLSCCVLARGQRVPLQAGATVAPDEFLACHKLRDLPIIYALDPLDALGQLFELQCKRLARRIAWTGQRG